MSNLTFVLLHALMLLSHLVLYSITNVYSQCYARRITSIEEDTPPELMLKCNSPAFPLCAE